MKNIILITFLFLLPGLLQAQTFQSAQNSAEKDLQESLKQLSDLRETIREEKIPLSKKLNELKTDVARMRREAEKAQRLRDNKTVDLNALENDVKLRRDELDYLSNLLGEFARTFESRIHISELANYDEQLTKTRQTIDNPSADKKEKLDVLMDITDTALDRMQKLVGGYQFEGRAIVPGGVYEKGGFTLYGPVSYYASEESDTTGLAVNLGSLEPTVVKFPTQEANAAVRTLIETGSAAAVPIDPTLGNAQALEAVKETITEHIAKGGIWIYPILTFAGLALVVALFKVWEIYTIKQPPPGTLHRILTLLKDGKRDEALAFAKDQPGPIGRMLQDGVEHSDESRELVEEVLYERMLDTQPKLERLLPFIAVTAATAPLMGLLGTVTGMINTFKLITVFGTGDAKSLSSGISEALVTTEFGLIVAIPSLILHALLSRKAQGVLANMEKTAVAFINGLQR